MKYLREALAIVSDQAFAYHSNAITSEYFTWVKDIIGNYDLAGDMEIASNLMNKMI